MGIIGGSTAIVGRDDNNCTTVEHFASSTRYPDKSVTEFRTYAGRTISGASRASDFSRFSSKIRIFNTALPVRFDDTVLYTHNIKRRNAGVFVYYTYVKVGP